MIRRPVVLIIQLAPTGTDLTIGVEDECIVMQASQLELGYDMARAKKPDLIAVDVSGTTQAAWTICRLLKRDPATASIPIVLLNAPATEAAAAGGGGWTGAV